MQTLAHWNEILHQLQITIDVVGLNFSIFLALENVFYVGCFHN